MESVWRANRACVHWCGVKPLMQRLRDEIARCRIATWQQHERYAKATTDCWSPAPMALARLRSPNNCCVTIGMVGCEYVNPDYIARDEFAIGTAPGCGEKSGRGGRAGNSVPNQTAA